MPSPTIFPSLNFKASSDGDALREAMKGFTANKSAIINILTSRSNAQRQEIAEYFLTAYGSVLIEDLKGELAGNYGKVMISLMRRPVEFSCEQLNNAMTGVLTNESTLVEILCTKTNAEIDEICETYQKLYGRPLDEHLRSKTSGDFRKLLTMIVTGVRDESGNVEVDLAKEQAEKLCAGLDTDKDASNHIFAHCSFEQLRLVFDEYRRLSGKSIKQAIKHEISGAMVKAMIAIVEWAQSPANFFASRLYNAMHGIGTSDTALIRIIVSRSEIDLNDIKKAFEHLYGRTLVSAVKSDTSGDYKHALCALIDGA